MVLASPGEFLDNKPWIWVCVGLRTLKLKIRVSEGLTVVISRRWGEYRVALRGTVRFRRIKATLRFGPRTDTPLSTLTTLSFRFRPISGSHNNASKEVPGWKGHHATQDTRLNISHHVILWSASGLPGRKILCNVWSNGPYSPQAASVQVETMGHTHRSGFRPQSS